MAKNKYSSLEKKAKSKYSHDIIRRNRKTSGRRISKKGKKKDVVKSERERADLISKWLNQGIRERNITAPLEDEYFEEIDPMTMAAILGNLYQESKLDPGKYQEGPKGSKLPGIGLGQWSRYMNSDKKKKRDPNKYRGYQLGEFAKLLGKNREDMDVQVKFMLHELMDQYEPDKQIFKNSLVDARKAVTLEEAVKSFSGIAKKRGKGKRKRVPGYLMPGKPDFKNRNLFAYNLMPGQWGSEYATTPSVLKSPTPSLQKSKTVPAGVKSWGEVEPSQGAKSGNFFRNILNAIQKMNLRR
tara:strand:+ start:178 stop:1071 length:894 start_codon:yes stop_codon:yes gene_type:complete